MTCIIQSYYKKMKFCCQNFYEVLLTPNVHQTAIVVLKSICKW